MDIQVPLEPPLHACLQEHLQVTSYKPWAQRAQQWCGTATRQGTPIGSGCPCAVCGANHHASPTAGTVNIAPYGGTFQVPSQLCGSQVPGAPQQGPPLHGPPRPKCNAVRAGPHPEDTPAGAFQGPCHAVPPPGPHNSAHVPAAPYKNGGRVP